MLQLEESKKVNFKDVVEPLLRQLFVDQHGDTKFDIVLTLALGPTVVHALDALEKAS